MVYQKRTNEFLRTLEGSKKVIFDLLETIKADERHKLLHVIHDQEIPKVGFKGWSVGFANMESIDKSKLEGNLDFLVKGYTYELAIADSTWGAQIMQTFQCMNLML